MAVTQFAPEQVDVDAEIERLGLAVNIAELERFGYTVVRDVVPLDLVGRLRDRIVLLAEEDRAAGRRTMDFGQQTQLIWRVLCRGEEFADAITLAEIHVLMTYLLGQGFRLNVVNSSVLRQGAEPQFLHSDNTLVPDPFPSWAMTATAVIPCDEYTETNGATFVVPGSHRLYRHPRPGEGDDRAVAIEAPLGSLVVWNGNLWHKSGRRSAPGERVVMHANFCRLHMAAYEDYVGHLPEEALDANPRLAQLVGLHLPWGFDTADGPNARKVMTTGSLVMR